jgi:hypothetical protein
VLWARVDRLDMSRYAAWIVLGLLAPVTLAASQVGCSSSSSEEEQQPSVTELVGTEIGAGDGSSDSVEFVEIYKASSRAQLIDLAFNPAVENELWVVGYGDDSTHVGNDVHLEGGATWKRYVDPAAIHFMHKPPAIAMGKSPFFGTCGDGDNSAAEREPNMFMGPALFSTDRQIFAKRITSLGSHYDMLHNTPFCRGIAHERENIYWVFNSHDRSIDKYNFNQDHGPGMDDHSDGEIYRYVEGQVRGVDDVPSHLVFDHSDGYVYIADTGNSRIVRLDPTVGRKTGMLERQNEPLKDQGYMIGSVVEEVVPPGTLELPSGIEVKNDLIYVTDTATSIFYVFDKNGQIVRTLDTGLEPGSLAGFTFGPDEKIWFADRKGSRVVRIDPKLTPN